MRKEGAGHDSLCLVPGLPRRGCAPTASAGVALGRNGGFDVKQVFGVGVEHTELPL